mmetsp:Transcript_29832/g.65980  ORF Transcript_29832/g.65980 Transcript_29832/m.65980 type:complete len:80 (+) Transcript_29832:102-341(+)
MGLVGPQPPDWAPLAASRTPHLPPPALACPAAAAAVAAGLKVDRQGCQEVWACLLEVLEVQGSQAAVAPVVGVLEVQGS